MCCYFFRSVSQARAERRKKSTNFHGPSLQKSWRIPSLLLTEGFHLAKTTSFNRNNFFRQKQSLLAEILSFDSICRNKMLKNPSYSFLQKQTKSLSVDHYVFCWHSSSKWKSITDVLEDGSSSLSPITGPSAATFCQEKWSFYIRWLMGCR